MGLLLGAGSRSRKQDATASSALGTFGSLGSLGAFALVALLALLALLFAFAATSDKRWSVDGVEGELFDNADFAHILSFYSFSGL